jgi:hypothetical protein
MCFSATASFAAAAVTAAVGVVTLSKTDNVRELPLAATALFFSAQQAVEGWLWLTLPVDPAGPTSLFLTRAFLFFALIFWPVFAPVAALLIEPSAIRRRVMQVCLIIGVVVAAYFAYTLSGGLHRAIIDGGHIVYHTGTRAPVPIGGLYLLATAAAFLASSHRAVALLGAIIFVGSITAYFFYWEAFVSVWCFFAAASSVVILMHFVRVRAAERAQAAAS